MSTIMIRRARPSEMTLWERLCEAVGVLLGEDDLCFGRGDRDKIISPIDLRNDLFGRFRCYNGRLGCPEGFVAVKEQSGLAGEC